MKNDKLRQINAKYSPSWYLYLLLSLGLIIFAVGVGSIFAFDSIVKYKLADGLVLRKGSESLQQWSDPPADIYLEIYLMNVTNPTEAASGYAKPRFVDQGPYVFREIRKKSNITLHDDNTLTFSDPIFYIFEPTLSAGKMSDSVTMLDLVVAGMSNKFARSYDAASLLMAALAESKLSDAIFKTHKRSIFKKYNVGELIWGHEDPLLVELSSLAELTGEKAPTTFGLLEGKNGTANGWYRIKTGEGNITAYQEIVSYKDLTEMKVWSTPFANMMNGTVGMGFRPFLTPSDDLDIFAGDICRSSTLVYDKTVMVDGVELFQYKPPLRASIPYPQNPDQKGFCTPDTTDCPPQGVINETVCVGQPILMAKPNFLHADPKLREAFEGFNPHPIHHDTFLYIEPITGAVLGAQKRLMLMFPYRPSFISRIGNIQLPENMPDGSTAFPMFWVNETAKVHPHVMAKVRNLVYPSMAAARVVPHLILATGIAISVVTASLLLWSFCRQSQRKNAEFELEAKQGGSIISPKSPRQNEVQNVLMPLAGEVMYQDSQVHRANQTGHSRNPSSTSSILPVEPKVANSNNAGSGAPFLKSN